jgi:hypothetical protein
MGYDGRASVIGDHISRRIFMATAKKVSYFAMQVPNRAGEAARTLAALAKYGINLLAFTGFPSGRRSQMDFIPANPASFLSAVTACQEDGISDSRQRQTRRDCRSAFKACQLTDQCDSGRCRVCRRWPVRRDSLGQTEGRESRGAGAQRQLVSEWK